MRLERLVTRLAARAVTLGNQFFLQQMPLAIRGMPKNRWVSLRGHWTSGNPKGHDLDLTRLTFLTLNINAIQENHVPGAFAELGVWHGNSAKVIHTLAPDRDFYLLDTFEGFAQEDINLDPPGAVSHHFRDASLKRVRAFLGQSERLHFIVGRFPDSAGSMPFDERFAFLHLDCDLYQPTMAALQWFYPRMSAKGLIIVHDYASGRWPGVGQAVDEFFADKPERPVLIPDTSGSVAIACHGFVPRPL